eukprot:s725_g6.t1
MPEGDLSRRTSEGQRRLHMLPKLAKLARAQWPAGRTLRCRPAVHVTCIPPSASSAALEGVSVFPWPGRGTPSPLFSWSFHRRQPQRYPEYIVEFED